MRNIRVAVVGPGRVEAADESGRPRATPRSHVGAILANSVLELAGTCEVEPAQRDRFIREWGQVAPVFYSVEALLRARPSDIACATSLAATQVEVLARWCAAKPRAIFCGQRIGENSGDAAEIVALSSNLHLPLAVNYRRRQDPRIRTLRSRRRCGPSS